MLRLKANVLSFLTVMVFCVIALASNTSKQTFKNSDKWIPSDFDPSKTTLLIETFNISSKGQQKMEDHMAEKYPYKYEFTAQKDIKDTTGKYADTKKYRFALLYSSNTAHFTKAEGASTNGGLTVTGFDYHFYDRETRENYPATNRASGYAIETFRPVINTIVEKFAK